MNKKIKELILLPESFDRNKTSFNPIYIREPEWDDFDNDLRNIDEVSEQEQLKQETDSQSKDDIEDETF